MLRRSCGIFHAAEAADVTPRYQHATVGGDFVAQQELEERGLSRARRTDQEDELALGDVEETSRRA